MPEDDISNTLKDASSCLLQWFSTAEDFTKLDKQTRVTFPNIPSRERSQDLPTESSQPPEDTQTCLGRWL